MNTFFCSYNTKHATCVKFIAKYDAEIRDYILELEKENAEYMAEIKCNRQQD